MLCYAMVWYRLRWLVMVAICITYEIFHTCSLLAIQSGIRSSTWAIPPRRSVSTQKGELKRVRAILAARFKSYRTGSVLQYASDCGFIRCSKE